MEDEEILNSKARTFEGSAVGTEPAEDTSTPTETQESAPVEAVIPEKERKNREAARSFFSAEMLAEDEIPEAEIVREEDAPLQEPNPPQQEAQQAASEEVAAPVVEPLTPVVATPTPSPATEGWPVLTPKEGYDIWGNILVDGTPMVRFRNEDTGKIELEPADPETGLALMSDEDLVELKSEDPDLYIQWMTEKNERKSRLGHVLTEGRKSEVTQTHAKLKQNGMPENVISAIHTRAEQMLHPFGGLVAPGIYQQAILGATAEMLAYGGDGLVDLAKAIIANHEATAGKPAAPAAVPIKAEVAPAVKPAPARLATGGIGATGGASPVKTAPAATKEYPPVDAATMAELNRLGMTLKDWYES